MRTVIFVLSVVLVSCTREIVTEYYDVTAMPVSQIYRVDSVSRFMTQIGDANKQIAASYHEKAKAVAEKNPEKAMYFLKRSITLLPAKDKYLELADLLWQAKQYHELERLYWLLVSPFQEKDASGNTTGEKYIFGMPEENIFYDQIASYVAENKSLYAEYTWQPRELGFNLEKMGKKLQSDPRIGMDTSSQAFKQVMIQFLDMEKLEEISRRPEMFKSYLASAPDSSLIYSIGKKEVREFTYDHYQDDGMVLDFNSIFKFYLLEHKGQPDRWILFEIKHQLPISTEFSTMVYAIDTSELASPVDFRHIYHRLVTYDKQFEVIDSRIIASQSGEDLTLADVNKNQIRLKTFKRNFQKPYKKGDYDNEVLEVTPIQEINLEITADGKIQEAVAL